jgi:outer membrane protein OmpA-like peptidoglycan-associated protein
MLLLFLGVGVVVALKVFSPSAEQKAEDVVYGTSDAGGKVSTISVATDGYDGYLFLKSPDMKRALLHAGLALDFTDDHGAYQERVSKFNRGVYNMMTIPVAELLRQSPKLGGYNGVIVMAICESRGADAVVGFAADFPEGKISELNRAGLEVVYTADSPSEFLLDLMITDFDLFHLGGTKDWRQPVSEVDEVLKRAQARRGNAFVLWEPELSKVMKALPDLRVLVDSSKFRGYIIDVLVVNRDFLANQRDKVMKVLSSYFRTMGSYSSERSRFEEWMRKEGKGATDIEEMLREIGWFDLSENCSEMFGVQMEVGTTSREGILDCIEACLGVLSRSGKLDKNALKDPYTIINRSLVDECYKLAPRTLGKMEGKRIEFNHLSEEEWKALKEVGILRVEPITFSSGREELDDGGKEAVDIIAPMLINNYPEYRVAIRGHTSQGDEEENKKLSLARAESVCARLVAVHNIDPNRIRAEGLGSSQPPQRRPDESSRSVRYRAARVEFVLLQGRGF